MKDIIFSQTKTITTRTDWFITKELYEAILKKYNVRPCYNTKPEDITFESFYQSVIGNDDSCKWIEYDFTTTGYSYHSKDYYSGDDYSGHVEAGTYTRREWLVTFIQKELEKHYQSLKYEFNVEVPTRTVEVDRKEHTTYISVPNRVTKYE